MGSFGDSEIAQNKGQSNFEPNGFIRRLGNCSKQRAEQFRAAWVHSATRRLLETTGRAISSRMGSFGDSEIAQNNGQSNFEPNEVIWRLGNCVNPVR
jgi:hypothetical protein